jgi:hypothetical protein
VGWGAMGGGCFEEVNAGIHETSQDLHFSRHRQS